MTMPWILLLLAVIGLLWWDALGAKWAARAAARRACRKANVRFLDEVALVHMRLARDADGRLKLRRDYGFEFCLEGELRYRGRVHMIGRRVLELSMDPYPV